jgi:hypothetical protein
MFIQIHYTDLEEFVAFIQKHYSRTYIKLDPFRLHIWKTSCINRKGGVPQIL